MPKDKQFHPKTEFSFTLTKGYLDADGNVHRHGLMRLATVADELLPLEDARAKQNPEYAFVLTLSRVITKLGMLERVNSRVVEGLFVADLIYLQDLYNRINGKAPAHVHAVCPECDHEFQVEVEGACDEEGCC